MAKITEEAREMIERFSPALVATAGRDGRPNVSPKGSFRVLDEEHVVFADIASPRTMANLRENPKIAAIVFDPSQGGGAGFGERPRSWTAGTSSSPLRRNTAQGK